jgi:hypothetical protein
MRKIRNKTDAYYDEDNVEIPDGGVVSVRLEMMDGVPRRIATVVDANDHRPHHAELTERYASLERKRGPNTSQVCGTPGNRQRSAPWTAAASLRRMRAAICHSPTPRPCATPPTRTMSPDFRTRGAAPPPRPSATRRS